MDHLMGDVCILYEKDGQPLANYLQGKLNDAELDIKTVIKNINENEFGEHYNVNVFLVSPDLLYTASLTFIQEFEKNTSLIVLAGTKYSEFEQEALAHSQGTILDWFTFSLEENEESVKQLLVLVISLYESCLIPDVATNNEMEMRLKDILAKDEDDESCSSSEVSDLNAVKHVFRKGGNVYFLVDHLKCRGDIEVALRKGETVIPPDYMDSVECYSFQWTGDQQETFDVYLDEEEIGNGMIESSMRRVQSSPVLSGEFRESTIWSSLPSDDYLDDDSPYDVLPTRDSSLAFLRKTTSLIQQLSDDIKDHEIVVDDKCSGLSENDVIVVDDKCSGLSENDGIVVDEKFGGISENDVIVVDDKCSGLSENDGIVVDEKFSGLSENDVIVVDDKCSGLSENDGIVVDEKFGRLSENDGIVVDEKFSGLSENDVIVVDDKCSGLSENDGIVVDEKFGRLSENDDDEDIEGNCVAVSKKFSELSKNNHGEDELKKFADVFEVPDDSISSETSVETSLDVDTCSPYYVLPGLQSRDSNLVFMLKPTSQVSKESTDSGSSANTITEDLEALQVPSEDSPGDTGDKVSTEKPETKLEQLRLLLEDEISHVNNLPCYMNNEDGLSLRNCSQRIKHKKRQSRNNVESSCTKLEAYLDEGHRISIKEEDIADDEFNMSPSQIQDIIRGHYGTEIEDHSKAAVKTIDKKVLKSRRNTFSFKHQIKKMMQRSHSEPKLKTVAEAVLKAKVRASKSLGATGDVEPYPIPSRQLSDVSEEMCTSEETLKTKRRHKIVQVTRTSTKAWTGSKFYKIGSGTAKLATLERLKKIPYDYNVRNGLTTLTPSFLNDSSLFLQRTDSMRIQRVLQDQSICAPMLPTKTPTEETF